MSHDYNTSGLCGASLEALNYFQGKPVVIFSCECFPSLANSCESLFCLSHISIEVQIESRDETVVRRERSEFYENELNSVHKED